MLVTITTSNPEDGEVITEFSNRDDAANTLKSAGIQELLRNPRITNIIVMTDFPHKITITVKE